VKTETKRGQNHEQAVDAALGPSFLPVEMPRAVKRKKIEQGRDLMIAEEHELAD
jgi:hypothetical protein